MIIIPLGQPIILNEAAESIYNSVGKPTLFKQTIRTGSQYFNVLCAEINLNDHTIIIMKPCDEPGDQHAILCTHGTAKGFHKNEYERLFDFGSHCNDFNPNKLSVVICKRSYLL